MCVCVLGQGAPYSPEGAALGGYGLDAQAHLGLRTAGETITFKVSLLYLGGKKYIEGDV